MLLPLVTHPEPTNENTRTREQRAREAQSANPHGHLPPAGAGGSKPLRFRPARLGANEAAGHPPWWPPVTVQWRRRRCQRSNLSGSPSPAVSSAPKENPSGTHPFRGRISRGDWVKAILVGIIAMFQSAPRDGSRGDNSMTSGSASSDGGSHELPAASTNHPVPSRICVARSRPTSTAPIRKKCRRIASRSSSWPTGISMTS